MNLDKKYRYKTTPMAFKQAMITGDKYRFTVLTSRLIRLEYNENGVFEDRATQTVVNRQFEVPEFTVSETDNVLTIVTENIVLKYTKGIFSPNSISIRYVNENSRVLAGKGSVTWHYNDTDSENLGGTARTLDKVNGACSLDNGLMSKGMVTVLDDSRSLIIRDDGWIEPRKENAIDQYVFCYGDIKTKYDYKGCLRDYYKLTGKTPLLPRFALGNWWSRHHEYTQDEYQELMLRFKKEEIPFSVAVIDMDWHYVDIDPKYGNGWTGYTWNKELFPDHKSFLEFLHREGLEVSLNLHPQAGVAAHEAAYKDMAEAMGIDPLTEQTVPFEIENSKFVENYFKILHHPLEEEGVRFWWMDWQQGNTTTVPGLDPLWMLNHFHYLDNIKSGRRGLVFSRYAGPGSHRYPIGFSGDTHITWESLDFQPYFTATASNIGYGWWSHDIGGHMCGYRDEELTTRWYQLGTFSPINRLHSSKSEFLGKEPWKYNKIAEESMKKFLKLRHELIPYIYTMNYRASEYGEPLVRPLYYDYVGAYLYGFKNEYCFGTQMIVSPITSPCDEITGMGCVKTYIPKGEWYDLFNYYHYKGDKTLTLFRSMYEMPVLVKSGGIVPLARLKHINDIENPQDLRIKVFAGDDNIFELYEDDGESFEYENGKSVTTKMELKWSHNPVFTIHAPKGDLSLIPKVRNYVIEFIGIEKPSEVFVSVEGNKRSVDMSYEKGMLTVMVDEVCGELSVELVNVGRYINDKLERLKGFIEKLEKIPNADKEGIFSLIKKQLPSEVLLAEIMQMGLDEKIVLAICEIITADC